MGNNHQCIAQTIVYSDIFDYPLKKNEIWQYLISDQKISKTIFSKALSICLKRVCIQKNGWYFLRGRENSIAVRLSREAISKKKLAVAYHIARQLFYIPTISLIGISGGLAMKNVEKNDDIDFFIITKRNTVWFTRLLILIVLELLGKHRRKGEKNPIDKVCVNMLIDENNLFLPKEKQDLYTAHEVAQMQPLFVRNNTHEKFLSANKWTEKFLPNAFSVIANKRNLPGNNGFSNQFDLLSFILYPLEQIAKHVQLWYMRNERTTEIVTDGFVAFHPFDYRMKILAEYTTRLQKHLGHLSSDQGKYTYAV